MIKALSLTLALTLTLAVSALAAETKGTVQSVDAAAQTVVLEDGTQLWVSEGPIANLAAGDKIEATYQMNGDKKIVTEMFRIVKGPEGPSTNFGGRLNHSANETQSE